LTGARALIERLIKARAQDGNEMGLHAAMLVRGRILLARGEMEGARADLEPALAYFRAHGLYYYEVQGCLALAACDLSAGREGDMLEHLRRALDLAARYDYEYWLQREVAHSPRLFAAPEAAELLPPDVREQLLAATATSSSATAADAPAQEAPLAQASVTHAAATVAAPAPKTVVDLTINMIGPVEIYRDPAKPFAADAWTTKRARDILCFIASRRHRRASKDAIIDTFWGESELEVIEKNFHPTVSHIRKALNSNQPLKQNFLLYRDGDYMINPEFSYRIDTEDFDRLVSEGEAARRAREFERCINSYEQAIAIYRGEFMQGSYDEWVEEQRSYYREQYLRMLEALAAVAQKTEDWSRSLKLAQQILRDDPFREDIHCLIMRAHAALGNRVAVKDQYETLRRLLRKELGVEPASETQKTYKELLG
jgi:DNA-binding SARP family transcriptional activator